MTRIMLIGGTGVISSHTASALRGAGHELAMFHRYIGAASETEYHGDRNSLKALAAALADFSADVVVDFACFRREQLEIATTAMPQTTAQYVFVSTCDVFGYPLAKVPIPELGPLRPTVSAYAAEKLACEQMVREWSETSRVSVTIVRPTYSLGDRFVVSLLDRSAADLVHRLANGREVVLPGDGLRRLHPSDSADSGRMIAAVAGKEAAYGKTYTVGSEGSWMTHLDYLGAIASAVGRLPRIVRVDSDFIISDKRVPSENLFRELTQFEIAFEFDQFKKDFPEFRWRTDLAPKISSYASRTLNLPAPALEYSIEQKVIDAWRSQ